MRSVLSRIIATAGAAFLLLASPGFAEDVTIGEPAYGGTGCPDGTVSIAYPSDWTMFWFDGAYAVVRYDQYVAEAGGTSGRDRDRKACNLAFPVHVPAGWSVALLASDQLGHVGLPADAALAFSLETFFAGSKSAKVRQSWKGPLDGPIGLPASADVASTWSACGADVIVRTLSSLEVSSSNGAAARGGLISTRIHRLQAKQC